MVILRNAQSGFGKVSLEGSHHSDHNICFNIQQDIQMTDLTAAQTTIFKSNKSQAVHLPKAVEFPSSVNKVTVVAVGNTRIITPVHDSWDDWFDNLKVSDDFMFDREQPTDKLRDDF